MKVKQYTLDDRVWFTSDSHYHHQAILQYCQRPFSNIEEMDEALINNWNATVGPDDTVYHLGDFVFGGAQLIRKYRERLNGKIHLILGNHDLRNIKDSVRDCFEEIIFQKNIKMEGDKIYDVVMNHYPFLSFPGLYHSDHIQLFGHVHSRPNNTGLDADRLHLLKNQYDVGVDNNFYKPVSFKEICQQLQLSQKTTFIQ